MNKIIVIPIVAILLFLIDLYLYQGIIKVKQEKSSGFKKQIFYFYWVVSAITLLSLLIYHFVNPEEIGKNLRNFIMVWIFMNYFSKFFGVIFLFIDDIIRFFKWIFHFFKNPEPEPEEERERKKISRSEFLAKASIIATAIPFTGMAYGIAIGAHDYRIRRNTIYLPNLPKEFDGIRIAQLSDIHSGSFFSRTAVKGGVEMLLNEKPDLVFFTGDIVNNTAGELKEYASIFAKVNAPLGVFSTLGNHDYGEYVPWPSQEAKKRNLENLKRAHKEMGWDLLLNENRFLERGGEKLAILGVENWGGGRFPKYGNLGAAHKGTEEAATKLLLSHDPSHWDLQVRRLYGDIDIMFAGHTHGFQFGIELGDIKWSPSQYVYKQWAGLYQEGKQYLYVNRGFGYLGFPGRVGIPPEITIVELKRG
jgi:uncharacterized protein